MRWNATFRQRFIPIISRCSIRHGFASKSVNLADKLQAQAKAKRRLKLQVATSGYLDFLKAGGAIRFMDLNRALLRRLLQTRPTRSDWFECNLSVSLGSRVRPRNDVDDDINGEPVGHFVLLTGYDRHKREILISDPTFSQPPGQPELPDPYRSGHRSDSARSPDL